MDANVLVTASLTRSTRLESLQADVGDALRREYVSSTNSGVGRGRQQGIVRNDDWFEGRVSCSPLSLGAVLTL